MTGPPKNEGQRMIIVPSFFPLPKRSAKQNLAKRNSAYYSSWPSNIIIN